jgi:vancomycin aglycone glucosyltransferase
VALRARGAEVRVCAPPDEEFVEVLSRAGVPVVPFAKSWRSWAEEETTAEERVPSVDEFVAAYLAATYETLAAAADGCDVLVATGMLHLVARSVADVVGIYQRFVVFSPSLLDAQPWHPLAAAPINAHRASLGLPPVDDVRAFLFTERLWLAADPTLSPLAEDPGVVRTPAWILPDARPLPDELVAFLDAGAPPVSVGFGSMRVGEESARAAIEAIRAAGHRVLLGRGWADLGLVDDRDDAFAIRDVNHQALFRRVSAVIHHGGAGTTTTAALAGAPQVIVPQAADQPYWADRVAALGIGTAHDGPVPTAASLSAVLATALSADTRARATAVAETIRTDGAAAAAQLVLDAAA